MHELMHKADEDLTGYEFFLKLVVVDSGMLKEAALNSSIGGRRRLAGGKD